MKSTILVLSLLSLAGPAFLLPQAPSSTTPKPADTKNITFVLSASKIPSQDDYSEIDAFVKVSSVSKGGDKERLGTTDTIRDDASPEWNNVFWVEWRKGSGQKLEFIVKDHDVLDSDDEAGEGLLDLDEFVQKDQNVTLTLSKGGELYIKGTQPIRFMLYARNVPELDRINGGEARGDPYVNLYWRKGKEGANRQFATSSVLDNDPSPDWPEVFEFDQYRKGTEQYLFFEVKDHDTLNADEHVGSYLLEADSYVKNNTKLVVSLTDGEGDGSVEFGIVPAQNPPPKIIVSAK
ncbi:unnamed protein product [Allacma fusca]|uniref:C2 domain-containing protein n=1 Tax=Allacma fusca TaxID=39272 RepID=A0A8J2KL49_9HEXA|nr:unnamed protein product [Allacma fusca]